MPMTTAAELKEHLTETVALLPARYSAYGHIDLYTFNSRNKDEIASASIGGSLIPQDSIRATGPDFHDALINLRIKVFAFNAEERTRVIRSMALAIITATADNRGQGCNHAALRQAKFTAEDIATYAGDACREADQMASWGPFTVEPDPVAALPNGAPSDDEKPALDGPLIVPAFGEAI